MSEVLTRLLESGVENRAASEQRTVLAAEKWCTDQSCLRAACCREQRTVEMRADLAAQSGGLISGEIQLLAGEGSFKSRDPAKRRDLRR